MQTSNGLSVNLIALTMICTINISRFCLYKQWNENRKICYNPIIEYLEGETYEKTIIEPCTRALRGANTFAGICIC